MRFLSKILGIAFILVVAITISFLRCDIKSVYAVEVSNQLQDNTIFNLSYENKIWTIRASEFKLDGKIFTINERINRYNKNGCKNDKIKLINKLINIKISPDVAFNYIYFGFDNKINKIIKNIEKSPQNAEIKIKNNKINVKKEIVGVKFDKYLFYNNLIELYKNNVINLEIPVIKTYPQITSDTLKKCTYKRGEFSTSIETSTSGRKFNIRKALNCINGTHLSKTEKFSFNDCVGPRTAKLGYKNAKVILDGEFVEGVGGGVCQVSSTLYNAVLLSGLNVIKSQKHSQRVGYVKAGFDAMVNYGSSDLVFENNTQGDIYILCNYTSSRITISVFGTSLQNTSFRRENEITDTIPAGASEVIYDEESKYIDKVQYSDEFFVLKNARDGYTIKSYLITIVDGVDVAKKLLRVDKYSPQNQVIVYGVKERPDTIICDADEAGVV